MRISDWSSDVCSSDLKVYPNGFKAIHGIDLEVADGEFIVLVGPSGCGKSTLLRMIAGLETVSAGSIRIGDRVVNELEPADRDIAMVFQNYALYPQLRSEERRRGKECGRTGRSRLTPYQ